MAESGEKISNGTKRMVHVALFLVQVAIGGYFVLAKAALVAGVNQFVFAVYRDAFGLSFLIPYAYFLEKNTRGRVTFTWPVLARYFLLGAVGIYFQQVLFYIGLILTGAAFSSAMQNTIPVFTLIIAAVFKLEHILVKQRSGQAKIFGILSCVSGALVMTFYKGPILLESQPGLQSLISSHSILKDLDMVTQHLAVVLGFGIDLFQVGAFCLIGNCLCLAAYINLQAETLEKYPAPLTQAASIVSIGAVFIGLTGIFGVKDSSEWIVTSPGEIVAIMYSGLVVSAFSVAIFGWAIQKSGPVLVAGYAPMQAVAAAILGYIVLRESFYLGSVLGAVLIVVGLYSIAWGQSKRHSNLLVETIPVYDALANCQSYNGDPSSQPLLG